jgi:hypothetical protein
MLLSRLFLKISKLPRLVEVVGENGEREFYMIKAASRKFGIMMVKVEEPIRKKLLNS